MRLKHVYVALFTGVVALAAVTAWAVEATSKMPAAFFPETRYEFAPVVEGTEVMHDFKIQNRGHALLKVMRVRTG